MKTAIFGGTFNPVHIGHLFLAEEIKIEMKYERVIFVPSNIPAHKNLVSKILPEQRLMMLKKTIENFSDMIVDDCEILRGGISYSIETVREIIGKYDITGKPALVIGDDLISDFDSWQEPERLSNIVDILIARRKSREKLKFWYPHIYMNNLILDISSSDIRKRIISKKSFRHIIPEITYRFICDNSLYSEVNS